MVALVVLVDHVEGTRKISLHICVNIQAIRSVIKRCKKMNDKIPDGKIFSLYSFKNNQVNPKSACYGCNAIDLETCLFNYKNLRCQRYGTMD